jgi:hypothetical protein
MELLLRQLRRFALLCCYAVVLLRGRLQAKPENYFILSHALERRQKHATALYVTDPSG